MLSKQVSRDILKFLRNNNQSDCESIIKKEIQASEGSFGRDLNYLYQMGLVRKQRIDKVRKTLNLTERGERVTELIIELEKILTQELEDESESD